MSRFHKLLPVAALAAGAALVPMAEAQSTTALQASLTGAAEVPMKGDPDGKGTATIRIKGSQVCSKLTYTKIGAPAAAHIHRGARGEAGPVVVELSPGRKTSCRKVPAELAREIAKSPAKFYVNVHNQEFAGGAIRGQLRKGSSR
jgi:hypothetical protein